MPDDHHPLIHPDRTGHALPREQALKPVYTMIGSAAIVIAWIELFWRHCL